MITMLGFAALILCGCGLTAALVIAGIELMGRLHEWRQPLQVIRAVAWMDQLERDWAAERKGLIGQRDTRQHEAEILRAQLADLHAWIDADWRRAADFRARQLGAAQERGDAARSRAAASSSGTGPVRVIRAASSMIRND